MRRSPFTIPHSPFIAPDPDSADRVEPLLGSGERLVSSFGPYHATSRRVILVLDSRTRRSDERGGTVPHELPYTDLESITEVSASDHKRLVLGAVLVIAGVLTLFAWFLIVPIVAIVMGIVVILQGSIGRPAYYQLKGRGMEGRDLYRWQVKYYGAGSFIASISAITGVQPAKAQGRLENRYFR